MCEINPRRKKFFTLEFFTAHHMSDARWHDILIHSLIELEQKFNATGEIRVHIHEIDEGPHAPES